MIDTHQTAHYYLIFLYSKSKRKQYVHICTTEKKSRAGQRQGRYCSPLLIITYCYIALFIYMTLSVNTCAYLYNCAKCVRNNQ